MRKYLINTVSVVALWLMLSSKAWTQDVSINVVARQAGVVDYQWPLDCTDCTVLITICNNDGGSRTLSSYKIRPNVSVPSGTIQFDVVQPELPTGWTTLSNTGEAISFSNGTDQLPAGECREFALHITPLALSATTQAINSAIEFGNGIAPGAVNGSQTVGDLAGDNSSVAGFVVEVPLPVKLISFDVKKENETAVLTWSTAEETNSERFELQYSTNARDWTTLGIVESRHESVTRQNYQYRHASPVHGNNYYRLKMIDYDDSFAYSSMRSLTVTGDMVILFPNPVADILHIKDLKAELVSTVSVIAANGRTLYSSSVVDKMGIKVQNWASGIYVLVIKHKDGSEQTSKFVVAR